MGTLNSLSSIPLCDYSLQWLHLPSSRGNRSCWSTHRPSTQLLPHRDSATPGDSLKTSPKGSPCALAGAPCMCTPNQVFSCSQSALRQGEESPAAHSSDPGCRASAEAQMCLAEISRACRDDISWNYLIRRNWNNGLVASIATAQRILKRSIYGWLFPLPIPLLFFKIAS